MSEAANPYAAPAARLEDVPANAEAEAIRRAHINHEASIKAVGFLYYLGGVGVTLAGLFGFGAGAGAQARLTAVVMLVLGIGQFFAGYGVRALAKWGRALGVALSGLGLLAFPVGTAVNAYILYLFLSRKGRTIFAPEYRTVIAATPHVKYRMSILVWIFLALVVLLVVAAVLAPAFSR